MKQPILRCLAGIVALVQIWAAIDLQPSQDAMDFAGVFFLTASTTVFLVFALYGSKAAERVFHRLTGRANRKPQAHEPLRNDQ